MAQVQAFDYSVNLLKVVLWQYENAPNLIGLITGQDEWLAANDAGFWEDWYTDVFNLDTANEFGLAVWSIILDLNLGHTTAGQQIWGFEDTHINFFGGNFATEGEIILSLTAKRIALKLRYHRLTGHPTVTQANEIVNDVFSDLGGAYVLDDLDMTISYVFASTPPSEVIYLLNNFDLMPRPAAVGVNYVVQGRNNWGFGEFNKNFFGYNFNLGPFELQQE